MALDVLASIRSTALIALVSASFSSPIVMKSDAFANASARFTGSAAAKQVATEPIVAGGVEFAMPSTWGRLGATAAAGSASSDRIGTVVMAACPAGSAGTSCASGPQLTFVAYSGAKGHQLPKLSAFERQLDARLRREFRGFRKGEAERTGDGMRRLDYPFTWRSQGTLVRQRYAAYRHADGSGLVVMIHGTASSSQGKAIDVLLSSAHDATDAGH